MGRVKLGDVAIEKRETWTGSTQRAPIVGLEHLVPGEVTLSSWDSDTDNTFSKMFRKGQVLLGRRRVYLKKAAIAPFDGICSGDITVIEAIPGKISSRLLPFVIQNERFFDYAMQGSAGSLSPRVKWEHLKDYEFNLPDYEEQDCLADKLWSALKLRESYHTLLQATDEMVKSRFIEQFDSLKKTALSEIAADWDKGQAFKKECIVNEGNTPCIHYGELFKYGPIIDTILSWTNESPIKSSAKGDILFPASDVTPNGLARCSALMSEGVLLGGDIIVLRLKSGFIPEFVSYAINMQKDQLIRRVTGSVVRHMSAKSLNSVEIPIPAIADQKQFIDIIRQADKSKFELKQAIEKIDKVMRALMQ